jgi:hypothetical protein
MSQWMTIFQSPVRLKLNEIRCIPMDFEPDTASERVAVVVMELMNGEEMTTRQVAELLGLTRMGAWYLMNRLCRVWDLRLECVGGVWRRSPDGKDDVYDAPLP